MIEKAIVCEIINNKVRVMIENECGESCGKCSRKNNKESLLVYNKSSFRLKKGDVVEIYAAPGKTILAGFLIFIVPLILFIVFYFTGNLVFTSGDELIPFLCGLSGVAFGFLLNFAVKAFRKHEDLPEITKVCTD